MGTLDRPAGGRRSGPGGGGAPGAGRGSAAGVGGWKLSDPDLAALRAGRIGFVFQQFHLAEHSSALENVADGLLYGGVAAPERRARAAEALDRVGLSQRATFRPPKLSGGERQRVAIARALVGRPAIVPAAGPTGNLDSAAGGAILELLKDLNRDGATVVVVTHNHELAAEL